MFGAARAAGSRVIIALLAASCGGCGEKLSDAGESSASFSTRDSLGIRLLENRVSDPSQLPRWMLANDAVARIGQAGGDRAYLLNSVGDVVVLNDGTIVLANNGNELRFYTAEGKHLRTTGGPGEGPGEFLSISGLVFARDTLYVWDGRTSRLSTFDRSGNLHSVSAPFENVRALINGSARLAAVLPDGGLFLVNGSWGIPRRAPIEMFRDEAMHITMSRDQRSVDTIARVGRDWLTGNESFMTVPFAQAGTAGTMDELHVVTHGKRYDLELRTIGSGTPLTVIRVLQDPPPLSESEFRVALDERVTMEVKAQMPSAAPDVQEARRKMLQSLAEVAIPYASKPAFTGVYIGDDRSIWAQMYSPPGDSLRRFMIFDKTGRLSATAEIPISFSIRLVRSDDLVGVVRDSLDVQSLVVVPLRK